MRSPWTASSTNSLGQRPVAAETCRHPSRKCRCRTSGRVGRVRRRAWRRGERGDPERRQHVPRRRALLLWKAARSTPSPVRRLVLEPANELDTFYVQDAESLDPPSGSSAARIGGPILRDWLFLWRLLAAQRGAGPTPTTSPTGPIDSSCDIWRQQAFGKLTFREPAAGRATGPRSGRRPTGRRQPLRL